MAVVQCCVVADMFGMVRLTDKTIEQRKVDFISSQEKNSTVRFYAKIACCCAVAAATAGGIYALCGDDALQVPAVTLEQLSKEVENLKIKLNVPNFGSYAWFKAAAMDFFFSPMFFVNTLQSLGKLGHKVANAVFYRPTLSWYIREQSKLGVITDLTTAQGVKQKIFAQGPLIQEIMHHAMAMEEATTTTSREQIDYHKRRIISNMNAVVKDMAGVIAFLQYKACVWNDSAVASIEAADRARYLFNHTNAMCDSLEPALAAQVDQESKKNLRRILESFFAELAQVVVSFVRLEDDSH
jgi:hypothetical protein